MRPRRGGGAVLGLAIGAVVALAWCAPALALEVIVEAPRGGSDATVALDQVEPDVLGATYTLIDPAGRPTALPVASGVSIQQLLDAAGADPVYSLIELMRPDGSSLLLSREQVEQAERPPVVYTAADGTLRFLRPSSGPADPNSADHFPLGDALVLRQMSRSTLEVDVSASPTKIDPGGSVVFEATASGGAAGSAYVFNWVFDDGGARPGGGPSASHRFRRRGVYRVLVTAAVAGSIRSDPAVVVITVGDPPRSDRDRKGGGTNKADGAPQSGRSDGGEGKTGSGGGDQASGGEPPNPAPAPAPPPASEPTPASSPSPPRRSKPEPPPVELEAPVVQGALLAGPIDSLAPKPLAAVERLAARDGTLAADEPGGGVPTVASSFGLALALLGLGAGWELRRSGGMRQPRARA